MITVKGVKPVDPFLHRFDNPYLICAFPPIAVFHPFFEDRVSMLAFENMEALQEEKILMQPSA